MVLFFIVLLGVGVFFLVKFCDIFVDSALKIGDNDAAAFDGFLDKVEALIENLNVNCVMTSSIPTDEASETVKKYL